MTTKVLNCRFPQPGASCVLFCFPWGGGGSNFYASWGKSLANSLEVVGITLSGRESRFNEPCCTSLPAVIDEVCSAIHQKCQDKQFAFWGHSMGAMLSFDVAREMKRRYGIEPIKMFVSGISAPHSERRKKRKLMVKNMTDEQLKQFLQDIGGTPKEVLENTEMMELFLPPIRADYELIDQFEYTLEDKRPLNCPIAVFNGKEDAGLDLQGWSEVTYGTFSVTELSGGHFYLKDKSNLTKILDCLETDPILKGTCKVTN